jgi:hypothetical protein
MTELLERAITALKKLPADNQNAIATRLLAEIANEQKWFAYFSNTMDTQTDDLADLREQELTIALAQSNADLAAGRYIKESAAQHLARLESME